MKVDRQANDRGGQTDGHRDRQTDRQTDKPLDGHAHVQTTAWHTGGKESRQTKRRTNGRVDRQTEGEVTFNASLVNGDSESARPLSGQDAHVASVGHSTV